MAYWFTSDTHWNHGNIIKYCGRPFQHVTEMNEVMISNWNECVKPKDHVYHLGDFSFGQRSWSEGIVWRLNGIIHFLEGNHDKTKRMPRHIDGKFIHEGHYCELKVRDEEMDVTQLLILCHYPFETWNKSHYGSWHLHGHCHGTLQTTRPKRIDVGVDVHDFKPLSFERVKFLVTKQVFKPVDHHKPRIILPQ